MPAGVVNGNRTKGLKRERIVNALAMGDTQRSICLRFHVSPRVVYAIERDEFATVAARKERLAVQAERGAMLAGDRLIGAIEAGHVRGAQLVAPYGVFVDKLSMLRGDNVLNIRHEHTHRLGDDDILAFAVARAHKTVKARVIDQHELSTLSNASEHLLPEKTGDDRPGAQAKKSDLAAQSRPGARKKSRKQRKNSAAA